MASVPESKTIGTNILLKKNKLLVAGNFPTPVGSMIFALSLFALGFLIPLVIFLIVFQPKMKKLENEIAAFLKEEYNL